MTNINSAVLPLGCIKAAMKMKKKQMGHNLNEWPRNNINQSTSSLNEVLTHVFYPYKSTD